MKKLYLLIGPMGCGKNYVGEQFAKELGYPFVDGDSFVPAAMAQKVASFRPLGQKDIDDFVTNHLIPGIDATYDKEIGLVVAQALYRKEHRAQVKQHFGDACQIILVKTGLLTNLKRLLQRQRGVGWMLYGLFNRVFFQSDDVDQVVLN